MGCGTRSEVKKLITSGVVFVNGAAVKNTGTQIDEDTALVSVSGKTITYRPFIYLMMNKPAGVLSATEDAAGVRTAVDLVGEEYAHYAVAPAGRLDKDSEGFLLLTNDGAYIHRVISPSKHVEKQYLCRLRDGLRLEDPELFRAGIVLGDGTLCRPAILEAGGCDPVTGAPLAYVTISEGKFHQVKRMFLAVGNQVLSLKRIRIGGVCLDPSLAPGDYREMTEEEKEKIIHE